MALGNIATMDSVEPPEYRQRMMDEWTAWLDEFSAAFQQATGIVHYEVFPDMDSALWSMHRRGDEPKATAVRWASIHLAKQKQQSKEVTMTPGQTVLAACIYMAAGVLCFMFGYLLAMVIAASGRVSRDEESMIPGEHEHLRKE